jgi:hypothetical protein
VEIADMNPSLFSVVGEHEIAADEFSETAQGVCAFCGNPAMFATEPCYDMREWRWNGRAWEELDADRWESVAFELACEQCPSEQLERVPERWR